MMISSLNDIEFITTPGVDYIETKSGKRVGNAYKGICVLNAKGSIYEKFKCFSVTPDVWEKIKNYDRVELLKDKAEEVVYFIDGETLRKNVYPEPVTTENGPHRMIALKHWTKVDGLQSHSAR